MVLVESSKNLLLFVSIQCEMKCAEIIFWSAFLLRIGASNVVCVMGACHRGKLREYGSRQFGNPVQYP